MQLECEMCHAPLRAENVRFDLALAKCHACNAVYDLSGRKALGSAASPGPALKRSLTRPKAALPDRLHVEELGHHTVFSWRWFKAQHVFMAFFCLFWDGMLAVMYSQMLSKGTTPLFALLFPLLHVGAGVFITYMTLTGFLNSTRIEVSRGELTIHHGPLPWPGNRTLSGRALAQLYSQEVRGNKGGLSYSLFALDKQGQKVKLLSGIEDKDQVLYLEQALERRLGIEDQPVDGELAQRVDVA